ncbi:hypothetical protein CALCODRAFT_493724, partial [Calocera cornea HHB12733]
TGGTEDVRTGSWLANLPPNASPLTVVDLFVHAGDWGGETIPWNMDTVALHGMKRPEDWVRASSALWEIWDKEGKEWRWPPEGMVR